MSEPVSEVDELFGEGEGAPEPKTTAAILLAFFGLFLSFLGMACLAAPGGLPVLVALWWIERERDRVSNGYLPEAAGPTVERARRLIYAILFVVIALFTLQAVLYCNGTYEALGNMLFRGEPIIIPTPI